MRLAKLEIYGFKSFMRRTEIVFPQNITGIVGPNGSGKSNISDAVRWVLGEQSARMLRGNNMSDVIFNGTEKRRPLNYCEVTLTFDNSDGQLPIAFAEVAVTRRVYRGGDGEYLLNGSPCRLRDIVDLFRDTGVGKEGYSIIGQGRIDEILSQRGEDRRAVFEEAAGISRFRARKEEAEARLQRTQENLTRVEDLLEEQKTHLGPLKRQAENAKKYLELSDKLRYLDIRLYLLRHERLSILEAELDRDNLHAGDLFREMEAQNEEIARRRAACEADSILLERQDAENRQAQLHAIDEQHAAKDEITAISGKIENGNASIARFEQDYRSLSKRLTLLEATLRRGGSNLKEAQQLLEAAQAQLNEKKLRLEIAVQAAEALENEADEHKRRMMDSINRIQNAKATQTQQETIRQQILQRQEEVSGQLQKQMESGKELQRQKDAAEEGLVNAQRQLSEEVYASEECSRRLSEKLVQMQQSQRLLNQKLQSARDAKTRLDLLRQLQDNYDGYQSPVRSALSYAQKMNIKGVHDVLARLIRVPKELETAIDMSLGAAMQNIVTDTEEEAKRLIEYLRSNSLGRVTFLPLNAVRPYSLNVSEREVLSMQGCVGAADKLIDFDSRYRVAIQNLLGRTVVAKTLEAGVEIARRSHHAFRVVTLQGDVLHSGGSMTGGSLKQKAQNLLGRTREIQELTDLERNLLSEAKNAETDLNGLKLEQQQLEKDREDCVYRKHQQEIAVVRENEHLKAAADALETHNARVEQYQTALEQLAETLADVEEKLRIAENAVRSNEDTPEELRERGEEISRKLDAARRARERAQEEHTNALLTQQSAQHELDRSMSDRNRLISEQEQTRAEMDNIQAESAAESEEMERLKESLRTAEENMSQKDRLAEEAARFVRQTEEKREENRQALHDILQEGDSCKKQMDAQTEIIHQLDLKLNRLRTQLSQLNDRLRDLYDLDETGAREELRKTREALPAGEAPPHFDEKEAETDAAVLREDIRKLGNVNVNSIEEYAELNERYTALWSQREDIVKAESDLTSLIAELLQDMKTLFTSQFTILQGYFSETFVRLFGGGNGEILLADAGDPLNCGIEIRVQPPGKKRQLLSLFSGGERTLTAIALLFAMLKLKPTPFCFLDEIEAALDDANIDNFADYLKDFSKQTQFVVVTHRKGTMERCDTLFGVAMEEKGITSMVSVSLEDYEKKLAQEEKNHE